MRRAAIHFLFWIGYVLFKTYLNLTDIESISPEAFGMAVGAQLVLLTVKVPLVYTCFFAIDKYLDHAWTAFMSLVSIVLAFALGSVLMSWLNHLVILPVFLKLESSISMFDPGSLLYHSFTLTFVVGAACTLHLLQRQYQSRLHEAELRREQVETELKYLKGQINPHFLFNTLNNIYALARKGSPETAESILRLAKLMRFMLYDAGQSSILLSDEIRLIQDYISLEQLRYTDQLQVTFKQSVDNPDQRIAPLLLIHFVENAFKHGTSESRVQPYVSVHIMLLNRVLEATIANSKGTTQAVRSESPIGMNNVRRQLELLYPSHTLSIEEKQDSFSVKLRIPLPS